MTFTTDPPIVGDIDLIPGQDEKADLNAPAGSGGKLVTGQIPNISISSTSVVADAAERLALDVQEGDVAIQTNVSSSFIFTGGDNVAPNWQIIDFDAVGAISGEDISPNNISALGDISGQDVTASGDIDAASFANANLSGASAGELLGSDGSGNLQFTSPPSGGDTFIGPASNAQVDYTDITTSSGTQTISSYNNAIVYSWSIDGNFIGRFDSGNQVYPRVKFTDGSIFNILDSFGQQLDNSMTFGPFKNVSELQFVDSGRTERYKNHIIYEEI